MSAELDQARNSLVEARAEAGRLTSELAEVQRRAYTNQAALDESRRQCNKLADVLRNQVRAEPEQSDAQKPKAKKPKPKNMDIEDA